MATYTNLNDLFTGIADAIRLKNGSTAMIVADTFPTEIDNLRTGFDYDNHDIVSIPDHAFYGCTDLKNVNCYNITNIGESAFEGCSNLKTIILWGFVPNVIDNIGKNAFKGCDNLTIYCTYPEETSRNWHENWNPDNCPVVWEYVSIESWDISADNANRVDALLFNNVRNDGEYLLLIKGFGDMNDWVYSNMRWYSYRNNISSIIINNGVTRIGSGAFQYCTSLTSINIPDSVTSIGNETFQKCTSLTSINIPDSVTNIGDMTFSNCTNLTSITIPDSVTSIGNQAFNGCTSLTSINIPDSVTNIGNQAFNGTAYYNDYSNWKNDVLYIDNHIIEANTTLSGEYIIKDGTLTICNQAFKNCTSLTSINIPDSVTSIGNEAFQNCTSLTFITIPDSVTSIKGYVLNNCQNLKTAGTIGGGYDIEFGWTDFIPDNAFNDCTSLTSVTIPDNVTSIGNMTFSNCTSLTSVTIPDSVTNIGNQAFNGCASLTSVTIPDSVTSIGNQAFIDCKALTSITIPDSITSIGNSVFHSCTSLTSITIPDSVTNIMSAAFYSCISLNSITYAGTVAQWKSIEFGINWNKDTGNYTIHCTDGNVAKNGIVTYHTT